MFKIGSKNKVNKTKLPSHNPYDSHNVDLCPTIHTIIARKGSELQVAAKDPSTKYNVLAHLKKVPTLQSVYDALQMS